MRTRPARRLALGLLLAVASCSPAPAPITVSENMIIVLNQTSRDWRNLVVTVNDHFRGGTALLAAHGRLTAPLGQFQTAFGQRYDFSRQPVFRVEVTATDASGEPVRLELDKRPKKN